MGALGPPLTTSHPPSVGGGKEGGGVVGSTAHIQ